MEAEIIDYKGDGLHKWYHQSTQNWGYTTHTVTMTHVTAQCLLHRK